MRTFVFFFNVKRGPIVIREQVQLLLRGTAALSASLIGHENNLGRNSFQSVCKRPATSCNQTGPLSGFPWPISPDSHMRRHSRRFAGISDLSLVFPFRHRYPGTLPLPPTTLPPPVHAQHAPHRRPPLPRRSHPPQDRHPRRRRPSPHFLSNAQN